MLRVGSDTGSHRGIDGTLERLLESYYWKGMYSDVVEFVQKCRRCRGEIEREAVERLESELS